MTTTRPELGNIAEGDTVFVKRGNGYGGAKETIEATVTKVARVWVTLQEVAAPYQPHPREWRMRRDTQDEGDVRYYSARFVTADQLDYETREAEAQEFLRSQQLRVDYGSPWEGREVELADLIRGAR